MSLWVNIRSLEKRTLSLAGTLPPSDLAWETRDELIQVAEPLEYNLQLQRMESGVLAQGTLRQKLNCECVRCLKPFIYEIKLDSWSCLLTLDGEECSAVVNDCVDLTPHIREDIFLAFPQHPLCGSQCSGVARLHQDKESRSGEPRGTSAVWNELNKLKFD